MEQITGRLTADAKVSPVNSDREVVNFSVAVNDRYKTKGGEVKDNTRFFKCAYWNRPEVAPFLKKGGLIELAGRIDLQVWNDMEGKAKGTLAMQVNNIRFLSGAKGRETSNEKQAAEPETVKDDLPF